MIKMNPEEKLCPLCGETIMAIAVKCKHCKSNLTGSSLLENTANYSKKSIEMTSQNTNFLVVIWKYSKFIVPILAIPVIFLNHTDIGNSIIKNLKSGNTTNNQQMREYIIGDVVQNKSLAYRVNGIQFLNRVGNFFIGQDAGQGNKFLIIDVEIKNIDTESRMIDGGEVRASYNGKWLKFESPEPVFSDDYITFDVLNPLTSVRGKVAFKVPAQLEGPFYWIPPRTDGRIKLTTQRDSSLQTQNQSKLSSPNGAISTNKDNTNAASKNKTNETEKTAYDEHFGKYLINR